MEHEVPEANILEQKGGRRPTLGGPIDKAVTNPGSELKIKQNCKQITKTIGPVEFQRINAHVRFIPSCVTNILKIY
jgi:hypothetical protein